MASRKHKTERGSISWLKGRLWEEYLGGEDGELKQAVPLMPVFRGQQGSSRVPSADVIAGPLHLECKAGSQPDLYAAMKQACRDAGRAQIPAVLLHLDGTSTQEELQVIRFMNWAIIPMELFMGLLKAATHDGKDPIPLVRLRSIAERYMKLYCDHEEEWGGIDILATIGKAK